MVTGNGKTALSPDERQVIDRLIEEFRDRPGGLLTVLERLQERHPRKYLSLDLLRHVAAGMRLPVSQVFSVVTFYAFFNLTPQGDHSICVCRGTACHTRGSRDLLECLKLELDLAEEDDSGADKLNMTTEDQRFTVRTVACFGQCALAPVVEIDHAIHGHINERQMRLELEALK